MNRFLALSKWSFFLIGIFLFACTGTSSRNGDTDLKSSINWEHLSSKNGDIPAPGPSTQQTASLILDIDKDGVNDIIIGSRKVGPALLWYRRLADGWEKYTIEPEFLAVEAGGTYHDIDGDGDIDIVFGGDASSNEIWWWENPYPDYISDRPWQRRTINNTGGNKHHDQIFGDFDGDDLGNHESKIGDINGDGLPDIVQKPFMEDISRLDIWLNQGINVTN